MEKIKIGLYGIGLLGHYYGGMSVNLISVLDFSFDTHSKS